MTQIPPDVMKVAEQTFDHMLCECVESCGGAEGLRRDVIGKIARVVMAERERCAELAREYADVQMTLLQCAVRAGDMHNATRHEAREEQARHIVAAILVP